MSSGSSEETWGEGKSRFPQELTLQHASPMTRVLPLHGTQAHQPTLAVDQAQHQGRLIKMMRLCLLPRRAHSLGSLGVSPWSHLPGQDRIFGEGLRAPENRVLTISWTLDLGTWCGLRPGSSVRGREGGRCRRLGSQLPVQPGSGWYLTSLSPVWVLSAEGRIVQLFQALATPF